MCGEVNSDMSSWCNARNGEKEGENRGGDRGENLDIGVNFFSPHGHCATTRFSGEEWQVRAGEILTVQVKRIFTGKHREHGSNITLKNLGLRQENKQG